MIIIIFGGNFIKNNYVYTIPLTFNNVIHYIFTKLYIDE